jgi:histidine kinase
LLTAFILFVTILENIRLTLLGGTLMSIRLRLIFSHTTMLIVTLIFFIIGGLLMLMAITGDIRGMKDLFTRQYAHKPLTEQEESVFIDAKFLAKKQAEKLLNPTIQKQYDQKLNPVSSGIVIRKGETVVYSSKIINSISNHKKLPAFEPENINVRDTINIDGHFYSYVKFDFYFLNQESGSVYVMKEVSPFVELTRSLFPILFGLLFLLLIFVNGLLSYIVSRSISRPLNTLQRATEQLGEGNLNYRIEKFGSDEIGQLSHAFENMRSKLKESVDLQLQFEDSRKELISNISHDLKTPITAINGYIEGIQDGVADTPEKLARYLSTIKRKATDMNHLIDDLFLFSKLDLKKLPFTFEEIEVNRYIKNYVDEIILDLEEQKILLELNLKTNVKTKIIADRDQLRRVITNIIDNSLKHMKKTEKIIRISTKDLEGYVEIEVRDNGTGIEPNSLQSIFERFYRGDSSRNVATGGSGLGLAIAKQIITEHGGTIWAQSNLGEGTSIFFTLKKSKQSGDFS